MQKQLAFAAFVEIALPVRIRVAMPDQFVATRDAGRDQFGAVIVERGIDERACRQFELIE